MEIDGNIAAMDRFMEQQDNLDLARALYGHQAHENAARLVLERRPEDVLDLLADDLPDALGSDFDAMVEAIRRGDEADAGRLIIKAADRCADDLVTDDLVNAEIARLKECDQ